jgi:hypothetical protein
MVQANADVLLCQTSPAVAQGTIRSQDGSLLQVLGGGLCSSVPCNLSGLTQDQASNLRMLGSDLARIRENSVRP